MNSTTQYKDYYRSECISFVYFWERRKRRKHIYFKINPDSSVLILVPLMASKNQILRAIDANKEWLRDQLNIQRGKVSVKPKRWMSGEVFTFLNQQFILVTFINIKQNDWHIKRKNIRVDKDYWYLDIAPSWCVHTTQEFIKKKVIEHYKKEALIYLKDRVLFFEHKLNVKATKVRVRLAKSSWGTCSLKGVISFNWNIIMAPTEVVDYVVIHELAHLKEFNHSSRFWQLVASCDRRYKEKKIWLKENGYLLSL